MMTIVYNLLQILIGFSCGVIIGGAFIALLTVLGIISRLIQLSKTWQMIHIYSIVLLLGTLFGTYISFKIIKRNKNVMQLLFWYRIQCIFNTMISLALNEILLVFTMF